MVRVYVVDVRPAARCVRQVLRATTLTVPVLALAVPASGAAAATAAGGASGIDSLMRIIAILQRAGRYIAIGSFMFSGVMWMGGHRTQATERAVGTAVGYLIVNHAVDIVDLLDGLK